MRGQQTRNRRKEGQDSQTEQRVSGKQAANGMNEGQDSQTGEQGQRE